jgi:hypothetical protein
MTTTVRRAIVVCVVVAAAVAAAPSPASEASAGIRFVVEYQGSFKGSWRSAYTKNDISGYKCGGDDASGTLESSVRPGSQRLTVVAVSDGRTVELDWRPTATVKGVVSYRKTAAGWDLDYQQGSCVQVPLTWQVANCGSRTFAGSVSFAKDSRGETWTTQRVFLAWQLEPESARQGCMSGWMGDPQPVEARAILDLRKLYRCGARKPRGCRFTIRGDHTHSHSKSQPTPDGKHTDSGSGRLQWSLTFVSVGRAR